MRRLFIVLAFLLVGCGGGGAGANSGTILNFDFSGPFIGVDWFAASNSRFPCDQALRVYENVQKPAFGYLWATFGDDHTCLYRFMQSNSHRPHLVRIHISNEWCRAREVCADGEIEPQINIWELNELLELRRGWILERYRIRIQSIVEWLEIHANENTRVILSGGLEPIFSPGAERAILELLEEMPYETANNGAYFHRNGYDYAEHHGMRKHSSPCIAALDGRNIDLPHRPDNDGWPEREVIAWGREAADNCNAVFLWLRSAQGIEAGNTRVSKPRTRSFSIDDQDVVALARIMAEIERNGRNEISKSIIDHLVASGAYSGCGENGA